MRDLARGETIQLDAAQDAPEPAEHRSVYQTANGEGSRVFFTSPERLTADSKAPSNGQGGHGEEDLYEFEVTSGEGEPLAGKLTDLTAVEHAGVKGVIGSSEDGTYVYFVAGGVLADGATSAANNLYVEHYDEATRAWEAPKFIAALSSGDSPSWGGALALLAPAGGNLSLMTGRVSPNGRWLAFMSQQSLTGYDNRDANSGVPDEEVFEYHAPEHLEGESGGASSLTCASCDPTGARPVGLFDDSGVLQGPLVDNGEIWGGGQP
jgi:hypothetical protein